MNYELYIQIEKGGEWKQLDMAELSVPMNYQINSLANLENRNGDYSQSISLPRTPQNMRLLGFGGNIEVISDIPYSKFPAVLYFDGISLTAGGSALRIISLKDKSIECQILGGGIDISKELSVRPMKSDKDDGFWRAIDLANIPSGGKGTLSNGVKIGYGYATLTNGAPVILPGEMPSDFLNDVSRIYPHLNFYDLVEWVFKSIDYNLESDILQDNRDNDYLPCICVTKREQREIVTSVRGYVQVEYYGHTDIGWNISQDDRTGVWDDATTSGAFTYTPQSPETINVRLEMSGISDYKHQYAVLMMSLTRISGRIDSLSWQIGGDAGDITTLKDTITCELMPGDELKFRGYGSNDDNRYLGGFPYHCNLDITATQNRVDDIEQLYPTDTIDLLGTLGFETQMDLVKAFLQCYGLTLSIGQRSRTVRLYSFSKIMGNKGKAKDWSTKMITDANIEVKYLAEGYAQSNVIRLEDNTSNAVKESVAFAIRDISLNLSKNLFSIGLMPFGTYFYRERKNANYPVYTFSESEVAYDPPKRTGIVQLKGARSHTLVQGKVSETKTLMETSPATLSILGDRYYGVLFRNILSGFKQLQANFNLSPADIENIDLFVPVWLEQYGHYFYIAKINNFTVGKLTKVDLIRL